MHTRRHLSIQVALLGLMLGLVFAHGGAIAQTATTFTYQGELKQNGLPANGTYTMVFQLWDLLAGGTQLATETVNGVQVSDGAFAVHLDFGSTTFNLFNQNRYLQIQVNGTTLSPRVLIGRAPYALQTRGIRTNEDASFVGIGRDTPFTAAEVFGLYKNTSDFAGMYVQTEAGGAPFYGYSAAGAVDAYHYFSDATNSWRLWAGADRISVEKSDGDTNVFSRLRVGGALSNSAQLSVDQNTGGTLHAILATSSHSTLPTINAYNDNGGPALHAVGTDDVTGSGGGLIIAGASEGTSIGIDNNEIMARANGAPSSLYLNAEGGEIRMGPHAIHPAFAYGKLFADGTWFGSSNITGVSLVGANKYVVTFAGGLNVNEVVVMSDAGTAGIHAFDTSTVDGTLTVSCYDVIGGNYNSRADASFVIYRP